MTTPQPAAAPAHDAAQHPDPAPGPTPAAAQAPAHRRSLLHHRDFRWLWAGDAAGQLGAQLTALVLPVYAVERLHASEWQMGLLSAAETAAFLVIGLPAGAWVDRMRKRRVLIVADLVRAAVLAIVVATAATGHASVALLVAAATAVSVANVFFDVSHQSYVPGLVGLDHIVEGNSKLQATQSVAMVAAPAIGGALLRVVAAPALIAVTVATYLFSAFGVGRIAHREATPSPDGRRPLRSEIAEGLAFVVRQPILRRIVATTSIGNFGGAVSGAVMVIFALRTLELDTAAYGTVVSAAAVGGLTGAFAADRISRRVGEARVIPISALAFIPAAVLTPLAASLPVSPQVVLIVGGVVLNFAVLVYNIAQVSFRQRLCPPALLGRMNASVRFIVWGVMPLGGLVGGWLGHAWGVLPTLWVSAAITALSVLPVVVSPLLGMRELAVPEPDDQPAAPQA